MIYVLVCAMLESSGRFNLHVHYVFDRMLNSVSLIHNYTDGHCNIILAGDFNSRTSYCLDCIDCDLDSVLILLTDDYVFTKDKGHTTSTGTESLDFCKSTSLRILNGRCADDAGIGKYKIIGSRGCSLVDFVLVS